MHAADPPAGTEPAPLELFGLGEGWAPILVEELRHVSDPQAWAHRLIAQTEPLSIAALRIVALRMQALSPPLIAERAGRHKSLTHRHLNRLCLATALRYTGNTGHRESAAPYGLTARRLVRDGPPRATAAVAQSAFDDLWLTGLPIDDIRVRLHLTRRATEDYVNAAPPRWVGKDIAHHFGWSPENHRLRLSKGRFPPPDGRDRGSDWWWPTTVRTWAESEPFQTCPHCKAQVVRLGRHLTKHRTTPREA